MWLGEGEGNVKDLSTVVIPKAVNVALPTLVPRHTLCHVSLPLLSISDDYLHIPEDILVTDGNGWKSDSLVIVDADIDGDGSSKIRRDGASHLIYKEAKSTHYY